MHKVTFYPMEKVAYCNHGDNLLEVARKAEVYIEAPCNGSVSCGKCKVTLLTGDVRPVDDTIRTSFKLEPGDISACHSDVVEDIEITVPIIFASSLHNMQIDDLS